MMTQILKGKSRADAEKLFKVFHKLVTTGQVNGDRAELGKLAVFSGVSEFPVRVKCATLAWHTLQAALEGKQDTVSTEQGNDVVAMNFGDRITLNRAGKD